MKTFRLPKKNKSRRNHGKPTKACNCDYCKRPTKKVLAAAKRDE